jgi:hypothetical protein
LVEKDMTTTVKTYNSVEEIAETLDKEIADTKSALGEYLRRLDSIRSLAEKSQKIREVVMKLANKKSTNSENVGEVEVGDMKIILEPTPNDELTAIEDAVRSHQKYLFVLQKAREALKPLDQLGSTEGLTLMVIEDQMVPQRILLKST